VIKEAMEWIKDHVRPETYDVDGVTYSSDSKMCIKPPAPSGVEVHTLRGLLELLSVDNLDDRLLLRVVDSSFICVSSHLKSKHKNRHTFAECHLPVRVGFSFGQYHSIDNFIINIQSKFVDTPQRAALLKAVSNISDSTVLTSEDDGVSQTVAVKNQVNRLEKTRLDPIVHLAPYRTFSEVAQPVSAFLLRLKSIKDALPDVALFEADGGAWRLEAIKNIAAFLREHNQNENHTVIA
jgi:hypothetical protein